ncbi:hypothetical protein HNO92_003055 [Chromobacterium alkanivorans]|uniref:DUF6058 family natural product biosynthesis protein n=1 Tax=Chromobacterium alkanivorans TaxID=1071719 RepID=UPI00216AA9A1|nr:hypothetical protein [Chromobacterium alkanivorans]MCS3819966.1 hypothetical protein [Chromobacterium alkanivorans]MCS3874723.1 hypothetical protein [Chromobacterium alkanivorans]
MEDLLDYLRAHFLAEPELLARSGVSLETLRGWQQAGAAPWPSYRLALAGEAVSCMGAAALSAESAWYPRGMMCWLGQALAWDGDPERLRAGFEREWRAGLAALELSPAEAELDLAAAWRDFLAGGYGVCTRDGLPAQIAQKEALVSLIDALTERQSRSGLEPAQRERLARAVAWLDAVAAPFAPHERAASSRARCVKLTRRLYLTEAA